MARPKVTLYTRTGCCLCDDAKQVLSDARRRADFDYEEFDIDLDPELFRRCLLYTSSRGESGGGEERAVYRHCDC